MAGSLAIGGVVLAGCAGSSGVSGAGPGPGECRSELASHEASLEEVVDSVALQAEVHELFAAPRGLVIAQLSYDSTGVLDTVRVRSEWMPEAAHDGLEAFMMAAAVDSFDAGARADVLIANTHSTSVRRLREVASCRPELQNADFLDRRLGQEMRPLRIAGPRELSLYLLVDAHGVVVDTRIAQGSGRSDVDGAAARAATDARFSPARIEGIPVPVWVRFPVTVQRGGR